MVSMRSMGIDYGQKRIGIAFSDEGGSIAFPYTVIENGKNTLPSIVELAEKQSASRVVIGESVDFGGRENPLMESIRAFKEGLESAGLSCELQPEQFSSVEAARFQGEGKMHDASSAAIILQRYLDKNSSNR